MTMEPIVLERGSASHRPNRRIYWVSDLHTRGGTVCDGCKRRMGLAAFLDEAATALRSATGKSIEVRRVTLDVPISFDRRRRVRKRAGNGPARGTATMTWRPFLGGSLTCQMLPGGAIAASRPGCRSDR
jgi:hypothetical protein